MAEFLHNTLDLTLASAPWLLLGLVAAGLIRALLPMDLVGSRLGGTGAGAVARAALLGAPLPLCSCGVLPAAIALRRSGASKAATTSFLISTPETSVDSVALSWVLLGPVMAVIRPFAALLSAMSAGLLVGRAERRPAAPLPVGIAVAPAPAACGCADPASCAVPPVRPTVPARLREGFGYAFGDLLSDIVGWLVAGLFAAGLVITLVPPEALAQWGSGLPSMLLMLAISVPMYVCATASTPLGHAMLWAGVSPGTVLVFLLAGPASNLAGLALVRREFGNRALAAYLVGVGGVSLLAGLGLDAAAALADWSPLQTIARPSDGRHPAEAWLAWSSLAVLAAATARLRWRRRADDDTCCEG